MTASVEEVLSNSDVPRACALLARVMGETVLDGHALSHAFSADGTGDVLAELLLELLVFGDRDRSAAALRRVGAVVATWAAPARRGRELGHGAQSDLLGVPGGAADRHATEVELEVGLRVAFSRGRTPRLADDRDPCGEHVADVLARQVAAIDLELAHLVALGVAGEIFDDAGQGLGLGPVRGRDAAGEHEAGVDVCAEVALVAVERSALALAAVSHLAILDRNAPVLGDTLPNARPAATWIGLEVLLAELRERRELLGERRLFGDLSEFLAYPRLESFDLHDELFDGRRLLLGVVPIDVEAALHAGRCERGRARARRELVRLHPGDRGGAREQLVRGVAEEIERVLDTPRPGQRSRVHREADLLGQLAKVERTGRSRKLDGALEEPAIHLVRDEPPTERLERGLRERGLLRAEHAKNHLPARVDDRHLDGLGVRRASVGLKQHSHCELSRRHGILPFAGVAVHADELVLERVAEQLTPVVTQKGEELLRARQSLEETLLPRARLGRWIPSHRAHRRLPRAQRCAHETRGDHTARRPVDPWPPSDRNDRAFEPIGVLGSVSHSPFRLTL